MLVSAVIPRSIVPFRAETIFILMINSIIDTTNKTFYHETIALKSGDLCSFILNTSVWTCNYCK
jgi:hypothetical protein